MVLNLVFLAVLQLCSCKEVCLCLLASLDFFFFCLLLNYLAFMVLPDALQTWGKLTKPAALNAMGWWSSEGAGNAAMSTGGGSGTGPCSCGRWT